MSECPASMICRLKCDLTYSNLILPFDISWQIYNEKPLYSYHSKQLSFVVSLKQKQKNSAVRDKTNHNKKLEYIIVVCGRGRARDDAEPGREQPAQIGPYRASGGGERQ